MSANGQPNGHGTTAFPRQPDVPIIGQPFTVKVWLMQLLVACNCKPVPEMLLIIGQQGATSSPCPACGRRFIIEAIGTGPLQLKVGMRAPDGASSAKE